MLTDPPLKKPQKAPVFFLCNECDYQCGKRRDYDRHILTRKHRILTYTDAGAKKSPVQYICECGKEYKHRQSLYTHKSKCINVKEVLGEKNDIAEHRLAEDREPILDQPLSAREKLLFDIIEKQTQVQEEQNKINNKLLSAVEEGKLGNTTNNNNQFNLNVFLNDKCKNALNITDFLESLQLQLQDVEETGRLGHVNGISRIFINALNKMDETERPIHCSDSKREILYIKDQNQWRKDDNKKKLKSAIDTVSNKNAEQLVDWQKTHPGCLDMNSSENAKFTEIALNSLGPEDTQEYDKNKDKIVKNIMKEVVIAK